MPGPRLPDGSPAWFVRVRRRGRYQLKPCAPLGWATLIGFVLAQVAGAALILAPESARGEPRPVIWIAWGLFFAASMLVFLVVAFRNSVSAGD